MSEKLRGKVERRISPKAYTMPQTGLKTEAERTADRLRGKVIDIPHKYGRKYQKVAVEKNKKEAKVSHLNDVLSNKAEYKQWLHDNPENLRRTKVKRKLASAGRKIQDRYYDVLDGYEDGFSGDVVSTGRIQQRIDAIAHSAGKAKARRSTRP